MMCDMVTLVAEEQSFQILRDVLIRFSSYFSAALESGMSEAQTNRFVFPNLSAQQLRLVTLCAVSNFKEWPAEKTSTHRDSITCFLKVDLLEVLSGAEAADYLQISALSQLCLQRLGEIMSRLFEPESIITHQHHNCGVFSCWLHWWTELNKDREDPFTNMFFQYTLRYPNLVLQPSSLNSTPDCLNLVIHFLSSDAVRVSDETVILDLIINWINFLLSTSEFCGSDILQSLLNCLRPGLLPSSALEHLFRFWSKSIRELKWKNQLSCDELSRLVTNGFKTGPFASLTNRVPPAYQTVCCPRASTPCLVSIIPSLWNNTVEFWLFNLRTGAQHNFRVLDYYLAKLSNNFMTSGDFSAFMEHRIFICRPTTDTDSNPHMIAILYYDLFSTTVNGFVWCMASCQARWLPPLVLTTTEAYGLSSPLPRRVRPKPIGVTALNCGLCVYYVITSLSSLSLHVYCFDPITWSWNRIVSTGFFSFTPVATATFTPVDQLDSLSFNDWLYANVEMSHRLHPPGVQQMPEVLQNSSIFLRFRPCLQNNTLVIERLPSPPLTKIHRILAWNNAEHKYLYAFGTSLDFQATTQSCFDISTSEWVSWSTYQGSNSSGLRGPNVQSRLQCSDSFWANFSPELLRFRGLLCSTSLLSSSNQDLPVIPDPADKKDLVDSTWSNHKEPSFSHDSSGEISPVLIFAGRPDYHICSDAQSSSGIWIHKPQIGLEEPAVNFDPKKPKFSFPNRVAKVLLWFRSPGLVTLANWENVIQLKDIVEFANPHLDDPYQSNQESS